MLSDKLQIYTLSLVFIGEFNPSIIQPFWLANKKLIREQEAEAAKIELIHNNIVKFNIDWAEIQINKNRFEIKSSKEPYFEAIKDLAISIFRLLKETPIKQLGINHLKHFALEEIEINKIENKITPLKDWATIIDNPKLLNIEILELLRKDGHLGQRRIGIQRTDMLHSGILINLNDHYSLNENDPGRQGEIFNILTAVWTSSFKFSNDVTNNLDSKFN